MALTRKFLSALGIEEAKIDEIISAHADTVNALKEQRDGYKADADKLPTVQRELDDLKAVMTRTRKSMRIRLESLTSTKKALKQKSLKGQNLLRTSRYLKSLKQVTLTQF